MTPHLVGYCSLLFLPTTFFLSRSDGLFELTLRPSRAHSSLLGELNLELRSHARHGGPRTLSRTADANLDCAFVEKPVFVVPKKGDCLGLRFTLHAISAAVAPTS